VDKDSCSKQNLAEKKIEKTYLIAATLANVAEARIDLGQISTIPRGGTYFK
jgi:hypothetical protein